MKRSSWIVQIIECCTSKNHWQNAGAIKIVVMKLAIDGMHCQSCVQRVRKAIEKVEGAAADQVEIGRAEVTVDPASEPAVLEAIRKAGYQPHHA
jgi:copper chaperone